MVDIDEIRELKELGIRKRKSEEVPGKYEYSFSPPCKICNEAVNWCLCTETLESAKTVIESGKFLCENCQKKPENMSEGDRERMAEIMAEQEADGMVPDWDTAFEQLQEEWGYDWGEPRDLEDGTTYWDCECSI